MVVISVAFIQEVLEIAHILKRPSLFNKDKLLKY